MMKVGDHLSRPFITLISGLIALPGCTAVGPNLGQYSDSKYVPPEIVIVTPTIESASHSDIIDFEVNLTNAFDVNIDASQVFILDGGGGPCLIEVFDGTNLTQLKIRLVNCLGHGLVAIDVAGEQIKNLGGMSARPSNRSYGVWIRNGSICPDGYIPIPGNTEYGTSGGFCVMKYEARARDDATSQIVEFGCGGTGRHCSSIPQAISDWSVENPATPVSVARALPWRMITKVQAISECQSLNSELTADDIINDSNNDGTYDLITNDEWQTIARNIEVVASNWKEKLIGHVATGQGGSNDNRLNRGHTKSDSKFQILVASASVADREACIYTYAYYSQNWENAFCPGEGEGWHIQKRTHLLSNGYKIWDFSGNNFEYVRDSSLGSYGPSATIRELQLSTHSNELSLSGGLTSTARSAKDQFGPDLAYNDESHADIMGYGLGYANLDSNVGVDIIRGGSYSSTEYAGVFSVGLSSQPYKGSGNVGFRCVYRP